MSIPTIEATRPRRHTKAAVASVGVAAAGLITALALTGPAQAGPNGSARDHGRAAVAHAWNVPTFTITTAGPTFGPPSPTFGTIGPTFGTIGPTFGTIPDATFGTVGPTFGTVSPPDVTPPDSMEATGTNPSGADTSAPNVDNPAAPGGFTLDITAARVNCDGMVHVEYATTATPEPPSAADHVVVFNPTSNPVDFHVVETVGNAPNGAFTFEQLGSIDDTYRVFVIALFDPANVADGPKLVDQADVLLAPNC